jgi:hypothetical protein
MQTKTEIHRRVLIGISAILLLTLACKPVFAIGWREILIVIILVVFLIGPPVYRFLRKLEQYRNRK